MADLVVDTRELRSAAATLRRISEAAVQLGGRSGQAMRLIPALGLAGPAQAADSFLSEWVYGLGWIGAQAHELAALLEATATAFGAVEAGLARGIEQQGQISIDIPAILAGPGPEPVKPASGLQWGLLAASVSPVEVQLSAAKHVRELVAGDPDQVADLARLLDAFAFAVAEARTELGFVNLSGWTSACAVMVVEQLTQLQQRLIAADNAFTKASLAVGAYAREHATARAEAALALAAWQANRHATKVLRGEVVGELPVPGAVDPAPELARAALKLELAQQAWETAGRFLVGQLREAEVGAPDDPGLMAAVTRAAASFGAGFKQGVFGMVEGAAALGALGLALVPTRAIHEPKKYLDTWEHLGRGLWWGVKNPDKVGAALVNLEGLKSDPFRWAGKLTPELITILATAGGAGAAKGAEATNRLEAAQSVLDDAARTGRQIAPAVTEQAIRTEIALQNVTPASSAGDAIRGQMDSLAKPDSWSNLQLPVGQKIAIVDPDSGFGMGALVTDEITKDAGKFFEGLQVAGSRSAGPSELPILPDSVRVFEVIGNDLDAATALARANPEAGVGGDAKAFVADVDQAIASRRIVEVHAHSFDPFSVRGRMEDPEYLRADVGLPVKALDPAAEQVQETVKVGGLHVARNVAGTGAVAAERITETPR